MKLIYVLLLLTICSCSSNLHLAKERGKYDINYQLQGGDVALLHLASNRIPAPWYFVWLAGGIASSKSFNLVDLRLEFLAQIWDGFSVWQKALLASAITIHKFRRMRSAKFEGVRFQYYLIDHPFNKLQKENSWT